MRSDLSAQAHALNALPHGKEFRFVDSLTMLEPGVAGEGTYTVSGEEHFLKAHFPGRPIMPAVILVEALAQLGGVVAQADPRTGTLSDLRLTALKNVKIFDAAYPGDMLKLRVRVAGRLGNLIQVEGQVECDGRALVAAQITLSGQLQEAP